MSGPAPALPSIDGFPPEYVDANNSSRIVGVVGLFHVLAFISVSLRVYVRVAVVRAFGPDDGLIIAAALLALGSWICLFLQIPYGLGRHGLIIPEDDRTKFEQINFWKTVISDGFGLGILRVSVAISLLRLSNDTKWYRHSLYAVIVFVILYTIQAVVWLFVYCTPHSGWWEFQWKNPFDPRCHDFNVFLNLTYWNIACNIFTDVLLGTLPVPIIWKLQMKPRVKHIIIGILNLGYFAVLMGILKAAYMLTTGGDPDNTFDLWVHFWQNLQFNIGIIAACASFLKPLVGRILKMNSTAAQYPSNSQYKQSSRTPLGHLSNKTPASRRRTGAQTLEDDLELDEFELHTKSDGRVGKGHVSLVDSKGGSPGDSTSDDGHGFYSIGVSSGSHSEERIFQEVEPSEGIDRTRDFKVQYARP